MIFLDTNFIIGYFIKGHEFYKKSNKLFDESQNKEMILSNLIINELTNTLNFKLKKNINEIEKVYTNNDFIVLDDSKYNQKAVEYMKLYYPKRIHFNDCIFMALIYFWKKFRRIFDFLFLKV
ncbi:MAG: type II toxin-antitoxin system VapC family toxin [Methanobrevibacter sp.]|jgi:predicted nucleic acid-binding protein|nr:type II toxin-antitoxin system VapC family toxin [Candidatus Methanovirga basalitermitum]